MASSIASSTMALSMDFSRATASAICKSSKRLAETGELAIGVFLFSFNFVFVDLCAIAVTLWQASLGGFDQFIGENQIGFGNICEWQAHQQRLSTLFRVINKQAHFAFVVTFKVAAKALTASLRHSHFNLHIMACPGFKISGAHQRAINARR